MLSGGFQLEVSRGVSPGDANHGPVGWTAEASACRASCLHSTQALRGEISAVQGAPVDPVQEAVQHLEDLNEGNFTKGKENKSPLNHHLDEYLFLIVFPVFTSAPCRSPMAT